tara:strand:- start:321 stop:560 length:240 start_codon:yes stop_codon:yes gene_type:complete
MEMFGNEDLNLTADASFGKLAHVYTADEIALMLGALGACVASIIYGFKNVKKSSCCLGLIKIEQRTELPVSKNSIVSNV